MTGPTEYSKGDRLRVGFDRKKYDSNSKLWDNLAENKRKKEKLEKGK